jgi:hypothetical protein
LNRAGHNECLALATEPLDPLPACYQLTISEADLRNFNGECALLRYLLTDEPRSWAISCYGGYKLFAGQREMLEALVGKPRSVAQKEFLEFARLLHQGDPESRLMRTWPCDMQIHSVFLARGHWD